MIHDIYVTAAFVAFLEAFCDRVVDEGLSYDEAASLFLADLILIDNCPDPVPGENIAVVLLSLPVAALQLSSHQPAAAFSAALARIQEDASSYEYACWQTLNSDLSLDELIKRSRTLVRASTAYSDAREGRRAEIEEEIVGLSILLAYQCFRVVFEVHRENGLSSEMIVAESLRLSAAGLESKLQLLRK